MIHHPIVIGVKLILIVVILTALAILRGVLTPEQFRVALWAAAGTFIVAVAALWVFAFKILANPKSKLGGLLILPRPTDGEGDPAVSPDRSGPPPGSRGVALSALRPVGTALFGHRRVSVVTEGEFIEQGSHVEIVSARGSRVVVRVAPAPSGE